MPVITIDRASRARRRRVDDTPELDPIQLNRIKLGLFV
jgi:hypothetical protein